MVQDYDRKDPQLLFVLRAKFQNCKKQKSESVRDYLHKLERLQRELGQGGKTVNNDDIVLTVMQGTHEEFGDFVSSVTGKRSLDQIDLDDLKASLIKEDELRRAVNARSENHDRRVMYVKEKGKSSMKVKFNGKNSSYNKSDGKNRNSNKNRRCYNCHLVGHYANKCPNPK